MVAPIAVRVIHANGSRRNRTDEDIARLRDLG
jgi:hypothetical protein